MSYTVITHMKGVTCPSDRCGFTFGLPVAYLEEVQASHRHGAVFCPRCRTGIYWPGLTDEEKLRRELAKERECCVTLREEVRALRSQPGPEPLSAAQHEEIAWLVASIRGIGWTRGEAIIREFGRVEAFVQADAEPAAELLADRLPHWRPQPHTVARWIGEARRLRRRLITAEAGPSNT